MLSDIIHERREKTIVIPASCILRDPWITKALITSSRELNKLYKKQPGTLIESIKRKTVPDAME